ncbi:MAG TPA: protein kinase [Polyangiaceae bacterium]|nr:protein kinase [Polyangiaceae bacterium]
MPGRVVLGRYRIVAPLARGGMGIIYLGRLEGAAGFAKPVVIKTVIPDARDTRAAQLFVREARILSNLEHPAIVGVLDFGEVDGEYIMVLEYVHGFHLGLWSRYVREARGNMPVSQAVEVLLPVLEALEFAHRLTKADGTPLDIVHRDVSPANILLDQQGHVKLHDFGIARMADDEFKTQDGTFRGTLSFTAPETLQGIPATARSDLYAIGVILYQLIAGSNPFRGDQPSETLHRVVTYVPPRLVTLRNDVPQAIDDAIAKAMEKDPEKRFESAEAFAAALRAARAWSAQEAQLELAHTIQKDFGSLEMPTMLGVDTLQSRDAAWRAAQSPRERTPLGSSRPPAKDANEAVTQTGGVPLGEATIQAMPSKALLKLASEGRAQQGENAIPTARPPADVMAAAVAPFAPASAAVAVVAEPAAAAPQKGRSTGVIVVAAVVGVLGLGGVAFGLLRPAAPAASPKFLLIEKQADSEPSASEAPAPASAAVAAAAAAPTPASASPAAPAVLPASKGNKPVEASSGSTITAAFQKQRGRIEGCFRQNAADTATPQLTIRFQVETNGSVRAAELSPASVAGTPLGACLRSVAQSTRFPASEAPVSFTIPITARKTGG